jgi:hypothetical protein
MDFMFHNESTFNHSIDSFQFNKIVYTRETLTG